jgi:hypothetical protein
MSKVLKKTRGVERWPLLMWFLLVRGRAGIDPGRRLVAATADLGWLDQPMLHPSHGVSFIARALDSHAGAVRLLPAGHRTRTHLYFSLSLSLPADGASERPAGRLPALSAHLHSRLTCCGTCECALCAERENKANARLFVVQPATSVVCALNKQVHVSISLCVMRLYANRYTPMNVLGAPANF